MNTQQQNCLQGSGQAIGERGERKHKKPLQVHVGNCPRYKRYTTLEKAAGRNKKLSDVSIQSFNKPPTHRHSRERREERKKRPQKQTHYVPFEASSCRTVNTSCQPNKLEVFVPLRCTTVTCCLPYTANTSGGRIEGVVKLPTSMNRSITEKPQATVVSGSWIFNKSTETQNTATTVQIHKKRLFRSEARNFILTRISSITAPHFCIGISKRRQFGPHLVGRISYGLAKVSLRFL